MELGMELGMTGAGVRQQLPAIERKGYLSPHSGKTRGRAGHTGQRESDEKDQEKALKKQQRV
jgi:predicted ArsR family transcriptional regulator